MKKRIALLLALTLSLCMSTTAFAQEINQSSDPKQGQTTLTTEKAATYIVVIPESAKITFDTEENPIGAIEYKEGNLEPDAYVTVTLSEQTALANKEDAQYTIPYQVSKEGEEFKQVVYTEETLAETQTPLTVDITKEAWEKAKAGNYEATLTFEIEYTNPHA